MSADISSSSCCAKCAQLKLKAKRSSELNIGYVANIHSGLYPGDDGRVPKTLSARGVEPFDLTSAEQFQALDLGKIDLGFV